MNHYIHIIFKLVLILNSVIILCGCGRDNYFSSVFSKDHHYLGLKEYESLKFPKDLHHLPSNKKYVVPVPKVNKANQKLDISKESNFVPPDYLVVAESSSNKK